MSDEAKSEALGVARHMLQRRQQLGLTQEHLARVLGVTTSSVSKWETGKVAPSQRMADLIKRWIESTLV